MDEILSKISVLEDKIINHRRKLHGIPELGIELPKTVKYVTDQLIDIGLPYKQYLNGNGLSVVIQGNKDDNDNTKVIGLRADMDGLPIQEETQLPFSSKNGNMHACGHDGHTAILLGVAEFLVNNRDLFSGKVKLIFQPGEEYPGGAKPMIEEGVLNSPEVTRMIGFHIGHLDTQIEKGKISYRVGPFMASMDRFQIKIHGKGYHGAYPEKSNDPIIVASQLISAIQTIKSRNIEATEPVVISVTHIEGGTNQNIIPDKVFLEGTVRTLNNKMRNYIYNRMQNICKGMSDIYNVNCTLEYDYKYPTVINEENSTKETILSLKKELGNDSVVLSKSPLMGGEDFAFYGEKVPSTFLFFANPGEIDGKFQGHHSSKFDIDESKLIDVVKAFITITLDYLNSME